MVHNDAIEDKDGDDHRNEEDGNDHISILARERDDDNDDDNVSSQNGYRKAATFAMNYRGVQDSIRSFDCTGSCAVERWIADFEDIATLFNWSNLERLVFAKKSLKGLAKLYVCTK